MNYIFNLIFLILIGCNNQSNKVQPIIDTAKLFDPNPQTNNEGTTGTDFYSRNIVLTQPDYSINFNEQVHKFSNLFRVAEFIKFNKEEIMQSKFYLIADSNTSFEKILSILDILKENKITDYRVITYNYKITS